MTKETKSNIKWFVIIMITFAFFVGAIYSVIHYGNQYTEHEYELYEMNDGVYAIYYTTHSRVPAHNYEVVTVCCNGNVYTFKGDVNILFTDGKPYVRMRNYNIANGDEIDVFVPQGTVVYHPGVDIGK